MEDISRSIKILTGTISAQSEKADLEDVLRWITFVIELNEELINSNNLNRYDKQRLVESIECKNNDIQHIDGEVNFQYIEGEFSNDSKADIQGASVLWDVIQTAFKNHVQIGLIINLGHRNIKNILNDARSVLERKINETFERYNALKVWIELNAEYYISNSFSETFQYCQ